MTESEDSRARRPGPSKRVRIVQLDHATLAALADGDLAAANLTSPVELTAYFVDDQWRRVWQLRAAQVVLDPVSQAWITGVIWDEDGLRSVGRAAREPGVRVVRVTISPGDLASRSLVEKCGFVENGEQ